MVTVDQGRTDKHGNREFLVETTGGPTKYYNKWRRRNPAFQKPQLAAKRKFEEEWFRDLVAELKAERLRQSLTQQELAQKLRTFQAVISNFEQNKANPTLAFLNDYAAVLGRRLKIKVL